MVAAAVGAVTVMLVGLVDTALHPPVPGTVYTILADPTATPLTTPEAFTVATKVLADVHVPPETLGVNVEVEPTQTLVLPLNVPAFGGAVTVIIIELVAKPQPPLPAIA